jgi:hypothetical protein
MPRKINKTVTPLPDGVELDKLVRYYSMGWRTGVLEEINGNEAGIRPINGYRSTERKQLVYVYVVDLKPVTEKHD